MADKPPPPVSGSLLGFLMAAIVAYGSIKLDAHLELEPNGPEAKQPVVQRNAG